MLPQPSTASPRPWAGRSYGCWNTFALLLQSEPPREGLLRGPPLPIPPPCPGFYQQVKQNVGEMRGGWAEEHAFMNFLGGSREQFNPTLVCSGRGHWTRGGPLKSSEHFHCPGPVSEVVSPPSSHSGACVYWKLGAQRCCLLGMVWGGQWLTWPVAGVEGKKAPDSSR